MMYAACPCRTGPPWYVRHVDDAVARVLAARGGRARPRGAAARGALGGRERPEPPQRLLDTWRRLAARGRAGGDRGCAPALEAVVDANRVDGLARAQELQPRGGRPRRLA